MPFTMSTRIASIRRDGDTPNFTATSFTREGTHNSECTYRTATLLSKAPIARPHPHRHAGCPSHPKPRGRHPADGDTDDNTHANNTVRPLAHPASLPSLVSRRLKCSFSSESDQVTERRPPPKSTQMFMQAHTHAAETTTRPRSATRHRSTKLQPLEAGVTQLIHTMVQIHHCGQRAKKDSVMLVSARKQLRNSMLGSKRKVQATHVEQIGNK